VTQKTNAARLLDRMGIRYQLLEYEVDPEDLAAESVAAKIGLPPEQLFKTLVAEGDRHGICMAVIPGNTELDVKALAAASGDRKIHSRDACPALWQSSGVCKVNSEEARYLLVDKFRGSELLPRRPN